MELRYCCCFTLMMLLLSLLLLLFFFVAVGVAVNDAVGVDVAVFGCCSCSGA